MTWHQPRHVFTPGPGDAGFFSATTGQKELADLGRISGLIGESVRGSTISHARAVPLCKPLDGAVYFTTSEGLHSATHDDRDAIETVQERIEKTISAARPSARPRSRTMGYNWRRRSYQTRRDDLRRARQSDTLYVPTAYPTRGGPGTSHFQTIQTHGCRQFTRLLGFTLGPDGRNPALLTGGPVYMDRQASHGKAVHGQGEAKGEDLH